MHRYRESEVGMHRQQHEVSASTVCEREIKGDSQVLLQVEK